MGLDMYLWKKTYIGNGYKKPEEQVKIDVLGVKQERVSEITEKVGQWRKANAIHAWFVQNVQDGNDNCGEYYVEEEELQQLLDTVTTVLNSTKLVKGEVHNGATLTPEGGWKDIIEQGMVLADATTAKNLLPTQSGFFFGSNDYDQYYWQDLEETKKILEAVLSEDGEYYYQSSW